MLLKELKSEIQLSSTERNYNSNSSSIISEGYTSSTLSDYEWDSSLGNYVEKNKYVTTSKLYFTEDAIYFKRGANEWLANKWTYEEYDSENNVYIFGDERGQKILINKDLTTLFWFYEYSNDVYKKLTIYDNLNYDRTVIPNQ